MIELMFSVVVDGTNSNKLTQINKKYRFLFRNLARWARSDQKIIAIDIALLREARELRDNSGVVDENFYHMAFRLNKFHCSVD